MSKKILVVDDEMRLRKLVHDFLVRADYEVLEAADGQEALNIFYANSDLSLIILDVMMPKKNGYEVLTEIRQESNIPVIMLTAKGEEDDELKGFSSGADEYISKPFSPKVLVARVQAVLKRAGGSLASEDSVISIGGIDLSVDAHEVHIDGKRIELSVKEFELLEYFIKNRGLALSREKILSSVWDYDYFGDARTIDAHVKKLRSKMGDKGSYIKTIWGMGYKFEIEE